MPTDDELKQYGWAQYEQGLEAGRREARTEIKRVRAAVAAADSDLNLLERGLSEDDDCLPFVQAARRHLKSV